MDILLKIFGEGKDLDVLQMCSRGIAIFIIALILIRIAGRRAFGQKKPLGNIIVILLGAILSRTVTGVSPFLPTVLTCLLIVVLHRTFAWISIRNRTFSKLVNGEKILVYKDGRFIGKSMERALIHKDDVLEQVRLNANMNSMDDIEEVYMEKTGELSPVKKER
ncbi:MAG: hypothetical protein K0Q79_1345 [Flavipsychrobacter sp.]|jgi:uncharacterized membrane protein YcaP (DUF421 family)|nr:hypothetical protein [Flavipsychrobacter sp.]